MAGWLVYLPFVIESDRKQPQSAAVLYNIYQDLSSVKVVSI